MKFYVGKISFIRPFSHGLWRGKSAEKEDDLDVASNHSKGEMMKFYVNYRFNFFCNIVFNNNYLCILYKISCSWPKNSLALWRSKLIWILDIEGQNAVKSKTSSFFNMQSQPLLQQKTLETCSISPGDI